MFDPDLPVILRTDASHIGLGACLNQVKGGKEVTVECASRTLSQAERNYSVGEKEALACVCACEKWHVYLWEQKENVVLEDDYDAVCQVLVDTVSKSIPLHVFNEACKQDEAFVILKRYIPSGWPRFKQLNENAKPFNCCKDELSISGYVIMRGDKLVVPNRLAEQVLTLGQVFHQGMTRTKQRLRKLFWWPLMDVQVEKLIKECAICQHNDKSIKHAYAPLKPVPYPDHPWEKLAMNTTVTEDCLVDFELDKDKEVNTQWSFPLRRSSRMRRRPRLLDD
ncbi:uncharacterized protein K02A2.6-like [Anneissia japonica]|uniref:uncharacterized protein K02A2.6-like n=1 Tax=Anneissia japonica TaxID=1529436 RepID=UPI0014255A37|nr:uncharacterized protein K02A2.6-like [Anneissia japonica]